MDLNLQRLQALSEAKRAGGVYLGSSPPRATTYSTHTQPNTTKSVRGKKEKNEGEKDDANFVLLLDTSVLYFILS